MKISSFGTAVVLTADVNYITPCDGYFQIGTSNSYGNNYAYGFVNGIILMTATANAGTVYTTGYPNSSVFVRKGSTIKFTKGDDGTGKFYPLQ